MKLIFTLIIIVFSNAAFSLQSGEVSLNNGFQGNYSKDTVGINKLLDLGKKYAYSDIDSSLYFTNKALKLSQELKNPGKEASSFARLGDIWSIHEVFDSSVFYYHLALDIYKIDVNYKKYASLMTRIGYSYYYEGQYAKSAKFFKEVVEIYSSENDMKGLSSAYNNLSACYSDLGNKEKAYNLLLKGLKINEDLKDVEGIANSYLTLGTLENEMENYKKAIEYYNKAKANYSEIGSTSGISMCLNDLGDTYSSLGEYDKALEYFLKSLKIDTGLNDDYGIAIDENNIADSYLSLRDTAKAFKEFKDVLEFAKGKGFNKVISTCCYNLAEICFNRGNFSNAISYGKISAEYSQLTGTPEDIMDAYKILAQSYEKLGKYNIAYGFLDDYEKLYDSLFTAEKSRQILEIEAKYESEKKEQENRLLIKKNETDKLIKYTLLGLLVVALIFIFTLYRLMQIKKRSERKLEVQKNFYEKLLGSSQDFVVVVDEDSNIKYISTSIENKIGRNPEDRVGKNVFDFVHPNDKKRLQADISELFDKKKPAKFEFRLSDVSGRYLNMAAYAKNMFDDPNIQGIIVNFWDITEIRKTETALKIANDTKDKIFSIISHDLRGPISSIKSIVDLVVNEFDRLSKDEIRDLLTSFKPMADATYFLLENLLSWAMNQMGKLKFDPGLNPIKPIVEANINLYSSLAESKDIAIISSIKENLICYFDKEMIDIVIRNLISNAVKFTAKGGEIGVNVKKKGNFLKVEVSDTGIGIDDTVVSTLFDSDIKNKNISQGTCNEKGAGIGLMICKEFVELNGGIIGAESKKDKGSVFFFTLPVDKQI